MTQLERKLLSVNVLIYALFLVFSYCYVDLNLTLSSSPIILSLITKLQLLGYYNRPIATIAYLLLIIISFCLYIFNIYLFAWKKIGRRYLTVTTILNTIILIFTYPFLSYDIFNYIFDAKIILHYHLSPYTHKALDFPGDDWIRFMRWTHRYSPYGPLWLLFSLIPAILGLGKFILNLFFFKIFIGLFHLINSYLIYKISLSNNSKNSLYNTALYALNPLFLLEGVANSHNDVVFAAFLLNSIYFIGKNKKFNAVIMILVGALLKYASILNFPWLLLKSYYKISYKNLIILNFITLTIFTVLFSMVKITVPFISSGSTQVQFQPWYLFWTIPLIFIIENKYITFISIAISFGALLRYLPYLYFGDWSQPGTTIFMTISILAPTAVYSFFLFAKGNINE